MDQLIKLLQEKTGVDDATANKIADFIKNHMDELPKLLSGDLADKASSFLGGNSDNLLESAKGFLGGNKD